MSNWLVDKLIPSIMRSEVKKSSVPEGLWHKCPSCDSVLYKPELEKTLDVCPKCNHHMRINARARLDIFLDAEGREELGAELEPVDRLKFRDSKKYKDRIVGAQKQTGEKDALVAIRGTLEGMPIVCLGLDRPSVWRRLRQFGHAWRCDCRRAPSVDRLCRPACYRANRA